MSIIHDALKKTQINLDKVKEKDNIIPSASKSLHENSAESYGIPEIKNNTRFQKLLLFFGLLSAIGGSLLAITFLKPALSYKDKNSPVLPVLKTVKKSNPPSAIARLDKQLSQKLPTTSVLLSSLFNKESSSAAKALKLNGTMISGKENLAIINNQIYQVGDSVNGMELINISLNKVELKEDKNILTLATHE